MHRSSLGSTILLVGPIAQSHDYISRIELLGSGGHDPGLVPGFLDGKYLPFGLLGPRWLQARRMLAARAQQWL